MRVATPFIILVSAALAAAVPPMARDECQGLAQCTDPALPPASATAPGTPLVCFYLTNDYNWAGEGINTCNYPGECTERVPDGLAGNIASAGPEVGETCFLYEQVGCRGPSSAPITFPGYGDLREIGFDRKAQAWRCWNMSPDNFSTVTPSPLTMRALSSTARSATPSPSGAIGNGGTGSLAAVGVPT